MAFPIREPSMEALRSAATEGAVRFRYGSNRRLVLVDSLTARAICAVYDALESEENKAKVVRMVSGTPAQLHRIAGFAFERVKLS